MCSSSRHCINHIGFEGISALAPQLPKLPHLHRLDFGYNNIGDAGIISFATAISSAPSSFSFRVLDFLISTSHLPIFSPWFPAFIVSPNSKRSFFQKPSLLLPTFSSWSLPSLNPHTDHSVQINLDSTAATAFVGTLPFLPKLTFLHLSYTQIEEAGFNVLLSAVKPPRSWDCKLESIDLDGNPIFLSPERRLEISALENRPNFYLSS